MQVYEKKRHTHNNGGEEKREKSTRSLWEKERGFSPNSLEVGRDL